MLENNIYCVNDKAIYDALNQGVVTKQDLIDMFLSRGVVISTKTSKKNLAREFSRRFHDFQDYLFLADVFSVKTRRERNKVVYIKNPSLTPEVISGALDDLRDSISDIDEASCNVSSASGKLFSVDVRYRQVNFNRSEFRQIDEKSGEIEIEKCSDGYVFRMPANDTFDAIMQRLKSHINEDDELEGKAELDEISLLGIKDPQLRSQFFHRLIDNMEDMAKVDVSDVYVYHPEQDIQKITVGDEGLSSDSDSGSDSECEDEEFEEFEEVEDVGEGEFIGAYVKRASLKGVGVLNSNELGELYDKGFYIWKIIWKSSFNYADSDHYEFEAQFSNPYDCSGFSYLVKGLYKYKSAGEYSSSRSRIEEPYTEGFFNKKVEASANEAILKIKDLMEGKGDESQSSC